MTTGRLLHVLGGGRWQLPTVKRAKAMGLRVLVTDVYDDRPAYGVADLHEVVDITDQEATLDAARRHGIDAILCDTTDVGVPSAAYVAERLGLPGIGYEVALNCTDKSRMRSLVRHAGLDCPPFATAKRRDEAHAAAASIGYPLVVKPVDNQSGRGVSIVSDESSLDAAFDKALGFTRLGVVLHGGRRDGDGDHRRWLRRWPWLSRARHRPQGALSGESHGLLAHPVRIVVDVALRRGPCRGHAGRDGRCAGPAARYLPRGVHGLRRTRGPDRLRGPRGRRHDLHARVAPRVRR